MPDIVYSYDSVPTVRRFSQDQSFIRGLMGPFGSGKSSGCVIELIKLGNQQVKQADGKRRARFGVIRNTYPQLKDTTIKTFHDWVPHGALAFGDWNITDHVYKINRLTPDLEIEVLFRALDRPEHVSNLLSLELTSAWVNEAREVPWAVIQALQARVGRYPAIKDGGCVRPGIIMDTNPPDEESWWYNLFEEKKPANARLFRQPSGVSEQAENLAFLRPGYYQDLLSTYDEDTAKVYVHGEYGFTRDGKPVYPEYVDSIHCRDVEPIPGVRVYRGWDFGLTPACTFSQIFPDGRWVTFDELVADNLDIHSFSESVLDHVSRHYPWMAEVEDIGDPSGRARSPTAKPTEEKSCFDILHGMGIQVQDGEQTLTVRLGSVKKALKTMSNGMPQVAVHSRCRKLRRGYQGRYRFKQIRVAGSTEEKYHDLPDKNEYSHPHDANQYVAAKLFGASIKGRDRLDKPIRYSNRGIV